MRDEASWSRRRPRPVADAPVAPLSDGAALAKSWLLALIEDAPLAEAAAVPAADLAREGPALCTALLEAVRSDDALARLAPGGDRAALAASAARLAGAPDPAQATAAVEALRGVTAAALAEHLRAPDPALVADLGERLAHVCAVIAAAAAGAAGRALAAEGAAGRKRRSKKAAEDEASARAAAPDDGIEEPERPMSEPDGPITARDARHGQRAAMADGGVPAGDQPWRGAIGRRLERHEEDGLPFALLVLEVDGVERLLDAALGDEVAQALEQAEAALLAQLLPADALSREHPGRYWLISPDTDLPAGRALGHRLADAVSAAASLHGAPLTISIGLAVCPDDAGTVDALIEHADEGIFAARAAGVRLA